MPIQTDGSGQSFVDTPTLMDDHVRATYIDANRAGYGVDSIRIQIRDATGHLRKGPEVPLSAVSDLIKAMVDLLTESQHAG